MNWLRELARRLRMLVSRRQFDSDLEEEMRLHLELRQQEQLLSGMTAEDARAAAQRQFGNTTYLKEESRMAWNWKWLEDLGQDVRYGARLLGKSPGFTFVAVLTLALGIGANTAIFTVINAVLLRPLSYASPQQLVTWQGNESQLDIDDIRSQADFFSAGGGVNPEVVTYLGGDQPSEVHAGYIDCGVFGVLGVPAALGRTFSPSECVKGGPRLVVISNSFWRQYLASDPNVLGKSIALDENRYTIIGVMPPNFTVPEDNLDLFVALRVAYPEAAACRGVHFMRTYWRLEPGVTLSQAAAGMATIDARLAATDPSEEKGRHTVPVPLQELITGNVRPALWVLWGAVGIVLLIACANFAGLLVARGVVRSREMTIRGALGGSRRRLIRQSLSESALLVALGGLIGLPLASAGVCLLVAAKPAALAHIGNVSMDTVVILFGFGAALVTGVLFGIVRSWNVSRVDVSGAMNQNTRTATAGPAGHGFRKSLVAVELALELVLLVAAGLFIKSFSRLRSVDPGFDPSHVVSLFVQLPATRYYDILKQSQFRSDLLDHLDRIPGVQSALVGDIPLDGNELTHSLAIEGRPVAAGDEPEVDTFCVMGDYFHVMRIAIRAGRALTRMDRENQPLVAVINETLAREYFVHQNPIGQRIRWARETGSPRWMTIVGVAADVKQYSLAERRFTLSLIGLFAGLALVLVSVGIYGVIAYGVSQRTREVGIRIAMGAGRLEVLGLFLAQGARLAAIGLAAGIVGALALTRLLSKLLFDITPTDPLTFFAVTVLLGFVALMACYIPARRAMRVDPMVALRYE
jgi:putative ABC transport system permease protein